MARTTLRNPHTERRTGQRRLSHERRNARIRGKLDRRTGVVLSVVEERRSGPERRRLERRRDPERRVVPGRRVSDRARYTPSPYSPAETAWIRDRLVRSRTRPACPKCGGTLTVGLGAVRFGIAVREVSCARCRRTLMVRERAGARVVVVDRELGARGALCNVLTQAGYDAEQAEDGDAALRLSQTNRPDVLIVSMANLGSAPLELIRRLRRELPGVGVVAMAGPRRYGAPDVLAQARSMAAIEILRAPFKPEELLRAVEAATIRPT